MNRIDRWLTSVMVGVLLVVTPACEPGGPDSPALEVRDSLGIRIVESSTPAWETVSGWRVSDAPLLEIGVAAGVSAEQFSQIMGVAGLRDGRWVIADGSTAELRVFDGSGAHLATWSRRGDGPGELRVILSFQRIVGDTLVVQDLPGGSPRFAFFDPEGAFVRRSQLSAPTPGLAFAVAGWLDGVTAVFTESNRPSLRPDQQAVQEVAFALMRVDENTTAQVASHPGVTLYGRETGPPVGVMLGSRLQRDVGPAGLVVALPQGAHVLRYDPDGSLSMVMRREVSPVDVSPQMIAEYLDAYVATLARAGGSPDDLDEARERAQKSVFADRAPVYSRVLVDREGNVWAREWSVQHSLPQTQAFPTFEIPDSWVVYDATGRWLGRVETPPRFHVFEIGAEYVAGVHRDELEVERVRVYGLTKR